MIGNRKINLKRLEEKHIQTIIDWMQDPDYHKYITGNPLDSAEKIKMELLETIKEARYPLFTELLLVIENRDEMPLGFIKLGHINWRSRSCIFEIYIKKESRKSSGVGILSVMMATSYVFMELNLFRIYATVYEYNVSFIKTLKKLGLKEEGLLREHVYRNGEYHNAVVMGGTVRDVINNLNQSPMIKSIIINSGIPYTEELIMQGFF